MNTTSGLALSRAFYEESLPLLRQSIPDILDRATIGLVGEGSECFGCDDDISRDHDWGPAFCVWLNAADYQAHSQRVTAVLTSLPDTFHNFPTRMKPHDWGGRVGLLNMDAFFARFIGTAKVPESWQEWRMIPEKFLAACTNGAIFADPVGRFTTLREGLLGHYPEDWRRKKIAAQCMDMAQTGQYNLLRAQKRGDTVSAMLTRARFAEAALAMVYLLNKRYMPFYKWAGKLAEQLPILGHECSRTLHALASGADMEGVVIENFCTEVAHHLHDTGLSAEQDSWLWLHGPAVQATISDPALRAMPTQVI